MTLTFAVLACAAALVGVSADQGAGGAAANRKERGTFRISSRSVEFETMDPALAYTLPSWLLLDVVCTRLMNHPDKAGAEGLQLVPEAAVKPPELSRNGRTYTFIVRKGLFFNDRTPIRAKAFARAIARAQAPALRPGPEDDPARFPGWTFVKDIVQVSAKDRVLKITLRRPKPDFQARTTMPFFCAVPPQLPVNAEGVEEFAGSGPYYIADYVRGRRIVLLRNRFYGGTRPQHVAGFEVDLQAASWDDVLERVERNRADWGWVPNPIFDASRYQRLVGRYGVGRSRFWIERGLEFRGFALNTSRPLFRRARMRRAVNFAVNRAAVRRARGTPWNGSRLTDQYLPPGFPGFQPAEIYPLKRANVRRASALAGGFRGSRKAVLYTLPFPPAVAAAQAVVTQLQRIGLDVVIRSYPPAVLLERLADPDEPWDLASLGSISNYRDPAAYLNAQFEGGSPDNFSHFDSRPFNSRLRAAGRLEGQGRYRAYGRLDVDLARLAAPMIAIDYLNEPTLVSNRVAPRCIVLRPSLDLAAVCLKR